MTLIDKTVVDNVTYAVNLSGSGQLIKAQVTLDNDNDRQALERFLGLWNFEELNLIAKGIVNRQTIGMDMQEMVYPQLQNPQFEGVKIGDGMTYSVHLTDGSFNQLMLKLFDILIEAVKGTPVDFVSSNEWREFLSSVETLRERSK